MCDVHCIFILFIAAQTEDEISCTADEEVIVLDDMGDGWLKVRKKSDNSEGFVPESYIEYV